MAAADFNRFQIQIHALPFQDDQFCLICNQRDSEPLQVTEKTAVALGRVWSHLEKLPRNRSLVHASCHPEAPYHYACLREWLNINPTCPLDRRTVNPSQPSGEPEKGDYTPRTRRVMDAAATVFGEKK